jgi:hypothetical protein
MSAALELAVRDINAAGGVLGARAEVAFADDACDANVAAPALDRLVSQGAKAIMGTGCSGVTLALLDKIQSAKVAMCAGANTAPALSTAPDGGYFFRTSYSQAMVGPVTAQLVLQDGHTSVAVLGRGDSFGEGLATGVKNALEARGAKVTKFLIYDPAQSAFEAEVASVVATKPEAIVLVGRDERAQIFRLLIERAWAERRLVHPGRHGGRLPQERRPNNPAVLRACAGSARQGRGLHQAGTGVNAQVKSSCSRPSSTTAPLMRWGRRRRSRRPATKDAAGRLQHHPVHQLRRLPEGAGRGKIAMSARRPDHEATSAGHHRPRPGAGGRDKGATSRRTGRDRSLTGTSRRVRS